MSVSSDGQFHTFREFYPYYLSEHGHPISRRLHFFGTLFSLIILMLALVLQQWMYLWALPIVGYGFAWVGHFFFEHNKPATFKWPLYSLLGDFVMFKDMLTRRIDW